MSVLINLFYRTKCLIKYLYKISGCFIGHRYVLYLWSAGAFCEASKGYVKLMCAQKRACIPTSCVEKR